MNTEEKVKVYDEIIKKATKMHNENCEACKACIEELIPELKDNEGEKIRKGLIGHLKELKEQSVEGSCLKLPEHYDAWIAWLEKQGEQKPFDYEHATIQQKDFAPKQDSPILSNSSNTGKNEQKSADKVEPKFHEGEWVAINPELRFASPLCIMDIDNNNYRVESVDGNSGAPTIDYLDNHYHLWTIQDAKDGDVLAYVSDEEDLWIMIYWSLYEPYEGHVHYHALLVNDNFADKGTCCICIDNLKPATKEQRDLLFQKMKETGYEWDDEKKELKKIEQKPVEWSDEDEEILYAIESALDIFINPDAGLGIDEIKGIKTQRLIDWLKSLTPQSHWKPSKKQLDLIFYILSYYGCKFSRDGLRILESLYQDLKKL